ncbi:hypothetical protein PLESTF_001108800 [Pleodorina starrii]|nr:hypothetical protein PLESTF_001108800 [Pleodorina starrii]
MRFHRGLGRTGSVSRGGAPRPHVRRRANTDEVKLLMLGYRQELARDFTALSSLTALGGTYGIGLTYGGPVVMTWGWLVVTFFTLSVGLSLAELASAYPTSGALYYWSFKLAPPRLRNLACWLTGWVLTMGQAAFAASNVYTFVQLLSAAVKVQRGVDLGPGQQFLLLVGCLAVIGLLNCGSARLTAYITTLGTLWHVVAMAAFCVTVPLLAPARRSGKYMYTSWQPHHEETGISSPVYTVLVGLLMQQWTLTGYDGSAHIAEETLHAEVNVPRAILLTILGVGASGYAFTLSLLCAAVSEPPGEETGGANVVLQILIDVTKAVYGSTAGGVALFSIPIVGTFFCSYQSIANNSRMLYAFARDNGVPLARFAKRVHPRTQAPVYGVLYMLVLTTLLATPMCFNAFVFPAVTSFAVVGCYLAYALPVLCKLSTGVRYFLPGPFHLGPRLSYANNLVSLCWVGTVTVLFTLPQWYPITLINMNWSAPILGLAVGLSLGWYYFPKYGAKHWFIAPPPPAAARLSRVFEKDPDPAERSASASASADTAAAAAAAVVQRSGGNSFTRRISRHAADKAVRATPSVTGVPSFERVSEPPAAVAAVTSSSWSRDPGVSGGEALSSNQADAIQHSGSFSARNRGGGGGGGGGGSSGGGFVLGFGFGFGGGGGGGGAAAGLASTAAAAAASRVRRHSALGPSLYDNPASCGSHIAQLLQDSGLMDESGLQALYCGGGGGGGGATAAAGDGRPSAAADERPTRERCRSGGSSGLRLPLFGGRPSPSGGRSGGDGSVGGWAVWSAWTGGGGGGAAPAAAGHSGAASGNGMRGGDRPSARARERDRTTPGRSSLTAAAAASASGGSSGGSSGGGRQLLALGGGQRNQRHPHHPCRHQLLAAADALKLTHSSDSGLYTGGAAAAARAHLQRASVSVMTHIGGGGGGGDSSGDAALTAAGAATISDATCSGAATAARWQYMYGGGAAAGRGREDGLGPRLRSASAGAIVVDFAAAAAAAAAAGRQPVASAQNGLGAAVTAAAAAAAAVALAPDSQSLELNLYASGSAAASDEASAASAAAFTAAAAAATQLSLEQRLMIRRGAMGDRNRRGSMSRLGLRLGLGSSGGTTTTTTTDTAEAAGCRSAAAAASAAEVASASAAAPASATSLRGVAEAAADSG